MTTNIEFVDVVKVFEEITKALKPCPQERIPVEEVFEQLKCSRAGLTSDEGASRLQVFGPNKLEEKKVLFFTNPTTCNFFFLFLSCFMCWNIAM